MSIHAIDVFSPEKKTSLEQEVEEKEEEVEVEEVEACNRMQSRKSRLVFPERNERLCSMIFIMGVIVSYRLMRDVMLRKAWSPIREI